MIWFHPGYRIYSLKHNMCKRCHSVKIEILKLGCTVLYIPKCLCWCWHQNANCENRSDKALSLNPRVSMLPDNHLFFHIFYPLKSSWPQCKVNSATAGSSGGTFLTRRWAGSSPSRSCLLSPSCTCAETRTGQWWRWWPRSPPLQWWTHLWMCPSPG